MTNGVLGQWGTPPNQRGTGNEALAEASHHRHHMASRPKNVDSLDQSVPVAVTDRHLPPLRNRRAAFVANLLSLFYGNEEETALLKREVGSLESYGGRLIPILDLLYGGGPSELILETTPDATLLRYFSQTLGLKLPGIHTLPHDDYLRIGNRLASGHTQLEQLSKLPDWLRTRHLQSIDGYVTDPTLVRLAQYCGTTTRSTLEASRRGNNKWLLHRHLESLGLPVFETVMAEDAGEIPAALDTLRRRGYARAVIKSQVGASGIGIQQIATDDPATDIPQLLFFEGPCMVQGWLEPGQGGISAIQSPSIQLYLDESDGVFLYDITEQILGHDSVHEGNVSPPPYLREQAKDTERELYRQSGIAASWLYRQGYRGTASVDFLLATSPDAKTPRAYVCEINARVTGATYPSILARHFMPEGAWLMRNLKFGRPLLAQEVLDLLAQGGHLYQPDSGRGGVLPINFNTTEDGRVAKGQFLCLAATIDACQRLLLLGERELPVDWNYVRD